MRKAILKYSLAGTLVAACLAIPAATTAGQGETVADGVTYADQGIPWTGPKRTSFYSGDQGSAMIPLAWLKALKTADGQPFLADKFARYGYLPNPDSDLPVGFTTTGPAGQEQAGMTCAACHTRQLSAGGQQYRVDGGPAIVDFYGLLTDMVAAVQHLRSDPIAFARFSIDVLGPKPSLKQVAELRIAVDIWYAREGALKTGAYPTDYWGVGRLDAVSMIFDRLTGLDIGWPPTYVIKENIQPADAPVRYPFLWDAPKQNKTQWPGFAPNGSDIFGLTRNTGEVIGVFGTFHPKLSLKHLFFRDFLKGSSLNFDGLLKLEDLVKQIGPPKWPAAWPLDRTLAAQGRQVYEMHTAEGGCIDCHNENPGPRAFPDQPTWNTPIQDVGTDSREHDILNRTSKSGVLTGAWIPFLTKPLKGTERSFTLLSTSVGGAILQSGAWKQAIFGSGTPVAANLAPNPKVSPSDGVKKALDDSFPDRPEEKVQTDPPAYESRMIHGIWAAAPYLHNGSVASLAQLLTPDSQRLTTFDVGPAYDTVNLGLATSQPGWHGTRTTTGCDQRNSGNSHCGHNFGTTLSPQQKLALLEYLKAL